MDYTVHGVAKSQTRLGTFFTFNFTSLWIQVLLELWIVWLFLLNASSEIRVVWYNGGEKECIGRTQSGSENLLKGRI